MAIVLNELPPPGSSQLEVMFRRMLLQCSQRAQQHGDSRSDDWQVDPKFHCIVDTLQEKLYELEHSAADRPSPDVLQLYKACVKCIVDELRHLELPAYCLKATSRGTAPPTSSTTGTAAAAAAAASGSGVKSSVSQQAAADEVLLRPSRAQKATARETGSTSTSGAAAAAAAAAARSSRPPGTSVNMPTQPTLPRVQGPSSAAVDHGVPLFTLSQSAQDKLLTQQRLQDDLTSELLDMGQELKASTLAMQSAIRFRGKLLDDTEVHLEHSAANAQSVAAKAKQQYKQSSWNFCQTLMLLLIVALVFCAMVVWIKLTSMVGLKGR